jgi:uncharacterized membrane protein (UPF0127 family)
MPASRGHFFACLRQNLAMKKFATLVLASLLTYGPLALAQETPQLNLQRTQLMAGMYLINAQVASDAQQRATGLMFRRSMPAGEGMLFIFEAPSEQCFWMKNTLLPLTAAFIADDGTILNLADMKPQTTQSHCSVKPVRYVLEMNQGWFAQRGIKAGFKLGGKGFDPAK